MKHLRFKPDKALGERLIQEAREAREKANQLAAGEEHEVMLKKAREADITAPIDQWLNSPGLKSPI
jgi:hypothetical protein